MKPVLLTDFGSTYTKLTAVDLDAAKLLGTAQAYTTVASDVRIGFQKALDALLAQTGPLTFAQSYACSSAAGAQRLAELSGLSPERVEALVQLLAHNTQTLPEHDTELEMLDYAVASMAVQTAVMRHAGTLEETYTMLGQTFVQSGKDLSEVRRVVVTGGSLIHSQRARQIARFACCDPAAPASLRPKKADIILDKRYILAAMGLLAQSEPEIALQIMKEEIN